MVTAIDIDLSLSNYDILTKNLEGLDHYFILDKNSSNVIMHSKAPYILRENITITQIEYGVVETQRDRFHDNVPKAPVEATNETTWFDAEVI